MSFQPGEYQPAYQPVPPPLPPPPAPRKRRPLLWIGLGLAGAALLGGAIWGAIAESRPDGSSDGSASGSSSGSGANPGQSRVVTASDRKSQLTVPESWRDVPESFRNEVAVIQLGNLRQEQYILVVSADSSDFDDFSGFEESCLEEANMAIAEANVGERRTLQIGGLPAVQYEVAGKVSGLRVVFWYTMIEGRNGFYQVVAWTLPSRKTEAEPTLHDVINSFRELGGA